MTKPNSEPIAQNSTALYIHVPFCRSRCAYCDFNTYAGLEALIPAYVDALCQEIERSGEQWEHATVPTIYFGGGTPSLLPLDLLARVFQALRAAFRVSPDAEITLEANPGTVTPPYLHGLRDLGFNRLSLGVQSAHDDELRLLGRIHTWTQAAETVEAIRHAGFENLSIDFIFGLPGQTPDRWRETLQAALASAEPEHLSLYALSVEEGTPLAERIARGELPAPDEDAAADMYELAEKMLAQAGFFHYEISNWAQSPSLAHSTGDQRWWPGTQDSVYRTSEEISPHVCRHNLVYWRNQPWLGVGAGAHSWMGGRRWANTAHPRAYISAVERGDSPIDESETIDRRLEMGETMMMGLRLAEGVTDERFRARFGVGLGTAFGDELRQLRAWGLLEWEGRTARLTARGRLLGNQVFAHFL